MDTLKHKIWIYPLLHDCPYYMDAKQVYAIDTFRKDVNGNTLVWFPQYEKWENQNKFLKFPFSIN